MNLSTVLFLAMLYGDPGTASVQVKDSSVVLNPGPKAPLRPLPLGHPPRERGMALGLFSQDPDYRYGQLLHEIVRLRATHLSVVWVWWQQNVHATRIEPRPRWSATDTQIQKTIEQAKAMGLHVTAFPIVRLASSEKGQWRGRIQPTDEDAWWTSYEAYMLKSLALSKKADRFCVGSELLSREPMRARWVELIERVRLTMPEMELLYSANWDHFKPVSFWDLVDVVGLTAYWELTHNLEATEDDLFVAWRDIKRQVLSFSQALGRRFVFTEVGYPSLETAFAWPWDETRKENISLGAQQKAYRAFVRAWSDTPALQGVYWWNWFGFGGPKDGDYTPRHKPASKTIYGWYTKPVRPPSQQPISP